MKAKARRPGSTERGPERQEPQRRAAAATQRAVLAYLRWSARSNASPDATQLLGISRRTLADWHVRWREGVLGAPRGRPARRATIAETAELLEILQSRGPAIGVPHLQRELPSIAKRELAARVAAYRAEHLSGPVHVHALRWLKPGRVWAMDFTETPVPIDGIYRYILSVRDLASGFQLAAMPTLDQSAHTTQRLLAALFEALGVPLVLKSDNGSGFVEAKTRKFVANSGCYLLLSPVRRPSYNGSCEAGIGGLKVRIHHLAAHEGRPAQWSSDDVETARLLGNAAPRAPGALSADETWARRTPIRPGERELFQWVLNTYEQGAPDIPERVRARRTMEDLGILSIRRRRFALPINPAFGAINS